MKTLVLISVLLLPIYNLNGRSPARKDTTAYLFPGQGSDGRLFKNLKLPPGYDTVHISFPIPQKWESLEKYALRFLPLIDTESPFILIGVSLGGMICTELADTLDPLNTIIISSAKSSDELPGRYTFQKSLPLNRILPKGLIKGGARILQGIVEPDRKYDKDTFIAMLRAKDPLYLKRTVDMIINWERTEYSEQICHIHGDKDHTIPIRNLSYDYLLKDGSHMMVLTRAKEINKIISEILGHGPGG